MIIKTAKTNDREAPLAKGINSRVGEQTMSGRKSNFFWNFPKFLEGVALCNPLYYDTKYCVRYEKCRIATLNDTDMITTS